MASFESHDTQSSAERGQHGRPLRFSGISSINDIHKVVSRHFAAADDGRTTCEAIHPLQFDSLVQGPSLRNSHSTSALQVHEILPPDINFCILS